MCVCASLVWLLLAAGEQCPHMNMNHLNQENETIWIAKKIEFISNLPSYQRIAKIYLF